MQLKGLSAEQLELASEVFKAFGNPIRIRIIDILTNRELRVKEMVDLLGYPQPIVSQQLKILRSAGIVRRIRDDRGSRYSLVGRHYSDMIKCMSGCMTSRQAEPAL